MRLSFGLLCTLLSSSALAVPDICDGGAGLLPDVTPPSAADVRIEGESPNDVFGRALATGDFNNDGQDDLAVGAPGVDDSAPNAGAVYIFFGGLSDPTDLSTANSVLLGVSAGDQTGRALMSGGDLDGDGVDDLVIGTNPTLQSPSREGVAYVVSGTDISSNAVLSLTSASATFTGGAIGDAFGAAVGIGDVTGDGFADVLVGAPGHSAGGAVYIFEGPVLGSSNATMAHATVLSGVPNARFGEALAAGLDFDGDGNDDFVIGARQDNRGGNHAGSTAFFLGGPSVIGGMDGVDDAGVYTVGSAYQRHGSAIAVAGDVDGSGSEAVWVSSRTWGSSKRGRVYLFLAENMFVSPYAYTADGVAEAILVGDDANDFAAQTFEINPF